MRALFPKIKPYAIHKVNVGEPHILHVEESGSKTGLPILFLHGGPGGGCDENSTRFFDPTIYRIITFDQRGCGQSLPYACLENNTTWDLVSDIEVIRKKLAINQWVVFGGSWGATLALAYAQMHSGYVLGLILRGIFLCRPKEIKWFYQEGANSLFPDYWESYIEPIPVAERDDLVQAFYKRLTGADELAQLHAAKAWSAWEGNTIALVPNSKVSNTFLEPKKALAMARIECHYFINNGYLESDQLLKNMHKIAHIPGIIVHGRYDVICPLDNAWQLHKLWPKSELNIISESGHSAFESGTTDALVRATYSMAHQLLTQS